MKKLINLRKTYLEYLKQNPKSYGRLKESCEFLMIPKPKGFIK